MVHSFTDEEIDQLPPHARIAFSVRCARRVEHLLRHRWPAVPRYQQETVREMIDAAERSSTEGNLHPKHDPTALIALRRNEKNFSKAAAFSAVYSAYRAAETGSPAFAIRAADFAALALRSDHSAEAAHDLRGLRHDYENVFNRLHSEGWQDTDEIRADDFEPIDPEEFEEVRPNG